MSSNTNWKSLAHANSANFANSRINFNLQEYETLCSMRFKDIATMTAQLSALEGSECPTGTFQSCNASFVENKILF